MFIKDPTPQSSFLSIEKDMSIITDRIMKNNRLKKLLYHTTRDALSRDNLTNEQTLELFGKNIKIIPKLYIDGQVLNYLIIRFDTFIPNAENPHYRDNLIEFDVICHFDQWQLKDFQLRPYRIAAEIDTMFNGTHLTGIGELQFLGAKQEIFTDEYAGLCLLYEAIHGDEDKKPMPNPQDQAQFEKDFYEMMGLDD